MDYLHNRNKTNLVVTTAIVILSIAMLTATEHSFTNVSAQTEMTNNTLFVSGSASNQTKPDKVSVSLGVETTNSTCTRSIDIKLQPDEQGTRIIESRQGFKKMKQVLPHLTSLQIIIIHLTTIKAD